MYALSQLARAMRKPAEVHMGVAKHHVCAVPCRNFDVQHHVEARGM